MVFRYPWSQEDAQFLRDKWLFHTAQDIADFLSIKYKDVLPEDKVFTRSMIVGRAHRMDLPRKAKTEQAHNRKSRKRKRLVSVAEAKKLREPPVVPEKETVSVPLLPTSVQSQTPPEPVEDNLTGKTIETLGEHDCRYPTGDPKHITNLFKCENRRIPGHSYCEAHMAVIRNGYTSEAQNKYYDKIAKKEETFIGWLDATRLSSDARKDFQTAGQLSITRKKAVG